MIDISDILFAVVSLVWILIYVQLTCSVCPALRSSQITLVLIGFSWVAFAFLRGTVLSDLLRNPDSYGHEEAAREISSLLQNGYIVDALSRFRLGNHAYRFFIGAFYAVTNGSSVCPVLLNATAAFCGLVTLASLIAAHARVVSLPLWCIALITLCPSTLIWCTAHLKEGLMCWAICTFIGVTKRSGFSPRGTSECLAFVTAATLRPHIFIAWFAAVLAGNSTRRHFFAAAVAAPLASIGILFLAQAYNPGLLQSIFDEGLTDTMERFHDARDHLGNSSITYATGSPVPIVSGLMLIFWRPYPTEVVNWAGLAAGAEYWIISTMIVLGWWRNKHKTALPLSVVVTLVVAVMLLGFEFSYMYNMGLMVRYRVQVFPAMITLAVVPFLKTKPTACLNDLSTSTRGSYSVQSLPRQLCPGSPL